MAISGNNIITLPNDENHLEYSETKGVSPHPSRTARTLAITSGKGGVGKSSITTNLAIALSQQGARVCIFDADTSLANVNVLMGLAPRYNIEHLLYGAKTLDEIMITGPTNVTVIPASSGIATLDDFDKKKQSRLITTLEELEKRFDYLIIDTAAGIGDSVIRFSRASDAILLVISTEPTSLTDAFALLRVLNRNGYKKAANVLVNMAINFADGMEVYKRFSAVVHRYLKIPLNYVGYITDDTAVKDSVRHQCPVVLYRPDALATRCFLNLRRILVNHLSADESQEKFSTFWKTILIPENQDEYLPAAGDLLYDKQYEDQEDKRRQLLNYLSGINLGREDLLYILPEIIRICDINTEEDQPIPEARNRLQEIMEQLKNIYQLEITESAVSDLHDMALRLSSTGKMLEHHLNDLNNELERLLS